MSADIVCHPRSEFPPEQLLELVRSWGPAQLIVLGVDGSGRGFYGISAGVTHPEALWMLEKAKKRVLADE